MSQSGNDHSADLQLIESNIGQTIALPESGSWQPCDHLLHERDAQAIVTARYTGRPLLAVGEPGVGKSQLARAAAVLLGRHFLYQMIQPGSEYQDLLWQFDHIERLGKAQLMASQKTEASPDDLSPLNFLSPGPLWWAFNWTTANEHRKSFGYQPTKPHIAQPQTNGTVLLIDEIDKADLDLPNGLLEALGNRGFSIPWLESAVTQNNNAPPPLIIITSNNMRELPAAFLRRCVVIDMKLPEQSAVLITHLTKVGSMRYPLLDSSILELAAVQIASDRQQTIDDRPRAGQAEYLDLLTALDALRNEGHSREQLESRLKTLSTFVIDKVARSQA